MKDTYDEIPLIPLMPVSEFLETDLFEIGGDLSTADDPSTLCVSPYSYQIEFIGDFSSLFYRESLGYFRLGTQHCVPNA